MSAPACRTCWTTALAYKMTAALWQRTKAGSAPATVSPRAAQMAPRPRMRPTTSRAAASRRRLLARGVRLGAGRRPPLREAALRHEARLAGQGDGHRMDGSVGGCRREGQRAASPCHGHRPTARTPQPAASRTHLTRPSAPRPCVPKPQLFGICRLTRALAARHPLVPLPPSSPPPVQTPGPSPAAAAPAQRSSRSSDPSGGGAAGVCACARKARAAEAAGACAAPAAGRCTRAHARLSLCGQTGSCQAAGCPPRSLAAWSMAAQTPH